MMLRNYPYYLGLVRSVPYGAFRRITHHRFRGYDGLEPFLRGKIGREIGGPSPIFRPNGLIPAYGRCAALDNCNFSDRTIWTGTKSRNHLEAARQGVQYVCDATDLKGIADSSYDFLLASHVLE